MHPAAIGFFHIERELGRGGMGVVYLARDTRLDREVAIKALPDHLVEDPDRLARFQREAKTLASLNHPNIAAIYGLESHERHQYLVLEYVEGETLAEVLRRGPIPMEEALGIAKNIAEALEAAHEKGVIHRDIKPGNVIITPAGTAKVLDFGLARSAEGAPSTTGHPVSTQSPTVTSPAPVHSPTIPGAIMGSAGYMSPEQARGKPVDKRSDIFSFGCVLYEMLTGAQPFQGETVTDSLGAILHRDPDWSLVPPGTPPTVQLLLRRCLTKDRNQRLHDIADARIEIQSAILDPASTLIPRGDAPIKKGTSRRREILAWLLAILCALGTGAVWFVARPRPAPLEAGVFRQLNTQPEVIFRAAFAPDGKSVVYSAAQVGNTPELFIVRPESFEPQRLGIEHAHLLSVSSKGDLAVLTDAKYIAHSLFSGTLARVSLGGGAPRLMLEGVREASWNPDGERLAIIREVDGKDRLEFPVGTALVETAGYFSDLRFDAKGDQIAYFEHPAKFDDRGTVNVVDLHGRSRVLTGEYQSMEGLAWSADGRDIRFSASSFGDDLSIFEVTEGGAPRRAYSAPGDITIHDINRDRQSLITLDNAEVKLMARVPGSDVDRDLSWVGNLWNGFLSQDGRTIAFTAAGALMGAHYSVCVRGTDGSPVSQLGDGAVTAMSADGKWVLAIVFTSPPQLVAYPVGPGNPVRLERGTIDSYQDAAWFRDGTRVLVNAAEPGKGLRYYIQEFKADGGAGPARPVTPEGVRDGKLTPDEQSVLACGPSGQFQFYPLDGGAPRPVKGMDTDDFPLRCCSDGKSVIVVRKGTVPAVLERVDLDTGHRQGFLTIGPTDLRGVTNVWVTYLSEDLKSYVYSCPTVDSKLFVTESAR